MSNLRFEALQVQSGPTLEARHSFLVFPEDLNYTGTLFGGKVLAEMDRAAVKAARKLLYNSGCDGAVTVSLDKVDFKKPAHLGDSIELYAQITELGRTSIHIYVHVARESESGLIETICDARFVFVSVKDGKPYPHNKVLTKSLSSVNS
ncbi:MAG TPA: hotdog domain-containing protein [Bacteroidia bacterium]|nr:hotdog domain-containing protein [Bacteroidia bacterium]